MMFWGCAMLWFRVKYLFIKSGLKSEYWPWVKTQVSGGNEKSELKSISFFAKVGYSLLKADTIGVRCFSFAVNGKQPYCPG